MSDRVICSKCGADEVISYESAETAVCPKCCEDHDYLYECSERWWYCDHCGVPATEQWVADRAQD